MNTHLTDDELVLHYYGELTGSDETSATAHLADCSQCHESFTRLQRVLAVVDERVLAGPELPEHFERVVWARLQPNLERERKGWASWFVLTPSRVAGIAAVVLLITAAFVAGRLVPRTNEAAVTAADAAQIRERILLVDLGEHLDRSQMVLVELAAVDDEGTADITDERSRAEQLVAANRLYRQTALSNGDRSLADLLDELERVLVDVVASPDHMSSEELNEVRRRIESKGLLFKVRVLSSDVRQRQRSIVQGGTGTRPSL